MTLISDATLKEDCKLPCHLNNIFDIYMYMYTMAYCRYHSEGALLAIPSTQQYFKHLHVHYGIISDVILKVDC